MHNTESRSEYAFDTIMWTIITYVWYKSSFFMAVPHLRNSISLIILLAIIVVSSYFGYVITASWYRNEFSVASTVLIPYGVYSLISFFNIFPVFVTIVSIVTLLLLIGYLVYLARTKVKNVPPPKEGEFKIKKYLIFLRTVLATVGVIALIVMIVFTFARGKSKIFEYGDQYTIASNIDTVTLLDKEKWSGLTTSEKMEVLQCVCHIEGNYMGLHKEIKIEAMDFENDIAACYVDAEDRIYIDKARVEETDSHDALESVCHEMFHAAQHRYVEIFDSLDEKDKDLYFFVDVANYSEEFSNYKSGYEGGDFMAYYEQHCEIDARKYAEVAAKDYYERIARYSSKTAD